VETPGIAFALLRGRAAFKAAIASVVIPDPKKLLWRDAVVAFVREQHQTGRQVLLCTASHRHVADAVAAHLGCFHGIVATDGSENTKGVAKLEAIRRVIGRNTPFDYMGDTKADLPILAVARLGYLVAPTDAMREQPCASRELSASSTAFEVSKQPRLTHSPHLP
jgi:phosphoserine phosphatase